MSDNLSWFWTEFICHTDAMAKNISEWKILHQYDRMNEEKRMLEQELKSIQEFKMKAALSDDMADSTHDNMSDISDGISDDSDIDLLVDIGEDSD